MDARVTKEPGDRDLRRRQLAHRLVMHHARTNTIFRLTGLSRHQLATLRQRWQVTNAMRHRGPAPTSFTVFTSTLRVRAETAALAAMWKILASANGAKDSRQTSVEFGERLCEAFEAYIACFPRSALELEHLVLLVRGLEEAEAIALAKCHQCEAVILVDLLGVRRRLCCHCQRAVDFVMPTPASDYGKEPVSSPIGTGAPVQHELF